MEFFEVSGMCLITIGKTIGHSFWIGLIILAMLRLLLAYIPVRSSGLRYSISVSALALLFISILGTFLHLYDPGSIAVILGDRPGIAPSVSEKLILWRTGDINLDIRLIYSLCGYIYFGGALFMFLRSIVSVAHVRALKGSGTQLDQEWQHRLLQRCRSLGIKRSVSFLESTLARGPMLVGYLKPAVIVPAGMITMLPVSQIETIIMHELYHIKRGDFLINIMQLFVEAVLFYHPVVWIISGFIRQEREHCCDDKVLRACDNPVNYARALIHMAEQQQFTRLVPGAIGSKKHYFSSRIKRILNYNTMKTNMRDKVLAFTLFMGSLVILLTLNGFSTGPGFFVIDKANNEGIAQAHLMPELPAPDTIPENKHPEELEEIDEHDWEAMKEEMEEARLEALEEIEEIDWEEVREEMEQSISEMKLDMAEIKLEIENSMKDIDWDQIREDIRVDLENVKMSLDSIKIDMDL